MAAYDTALGIISDAAVELGLGAVADAYGSTDAHVVQLCALLKSLGRALVRENKFLQLRKEHSFTTTSATTYALPSDFLEYVDATGWNRTAQMPLVPTSPQDWQRLKAAGDTLAFQVLFRPRDTTLELWPQPPAAGDTVAFEYMSDAWVATAAGLSPTLNAPTANTHAIALDSLLMVRGLKVAFLQAKGFDSSAALREYETTWAAVSGAGVGTAPVLSMRGGRGGPPAMPSAPLTGFGFDGQGGLG